MRFSAVCLLVLVFMGAPVLMGCGGGGGTGGKKSDPSESVKMQGATLPGSPGAPNAGTKK